VLLALIALAFAGVYFAFSALSSRYFLLPPEKFNIVVADIGVVDASGNVRAALEGASVAGTVAETLRAMARDAEDVAPYFAAWTDSLRDTHNLLARFWRRVGHHGRRAA
jgi:hypothetical protein